jgi:ribosomal-protein-alanine N-acetyltransferase
VTKVVVRPAASHDIAGVVAIEEESFADPWSARAFRDALGNTAVYFACATLSDEDRVVGYVVAWFAADQGEIANIAVEAAGRRKGIGAELLDAALVEGKSRGAEAIFLEVRDSNTSARALYRSRDFEEVGRRRNYYKRPVEDAIVLKRLMGR